MTTTTYTNKLHAGAKFPQIEVSLGDNSLNLGDARGDTDWQLVVVYRGKHCPMCTKYLNELNDYVQPLADIGVDVVAVSGDSQEQLNAHRDDLEVDFDLAHGLSTAQMQALGVFVSEPRSKEETDHLFAEPGLFVVNQDRCVQVADISNNPFVRPDIATLVKGLKWIRDPDNNYPIRGTHR